jgi:hypothetical protein
MKKEKNYVNKSFIYKFKVKTWYNINWEFLIIGYEERTFLKKNLPILDPDFRLFPFLEFH